MPATRSGFTFIELTLVVVIIGLLSAIAVPQFGQYKQRARNASVALLVAEIGSLQREYRAENGRYLACPLNPPPDSREWAAHESWQKLGFAPQLPLYDHQLEVEAGESAFTVYAVKDGQRVMTTDQTTFAVIDLSEAK